ncbi:MAG: hypothetical protein H8D84_02135, partial [Proteobacteria bacterium]|nr:hypothetical protein [Pseudomonadota bacterium]
MPKKAFPKNFWVGKRPSKDFHPAQGNVQKEFKGNTIRSKVGKKSTGEAISYHGTKHMDDAGINAGHFNTATGTTYPGENIYSNKDDTKTTTSTEPNHTFLHNISDPNQLFKYASYNVLFTLSALSQSNLEDVS